MTHISKFIPKVAPPEWDDIPANVCPKCWEIHRCDTCHDGGRLRDALPRDDLNFGKSYLCPDCKGRSHENSGPPENTDDRMRIPVAYRDANIVRLATDQRAAIQDIISSQPQKFLVTISGNVGTGKTYAGIVALRWHLNAIGQRGAFWPVTDLLERYRATFDADRATEITTTIDEELRRTSLVVLDDWGKQKATEWAEQQLFRLLDERLRNARRTIVTTNFKPTDFPDALRSRLFGNMAKVVAFAGPDRRKP